MTSNLDDIQQLILKYFHIMNDPEGITEADFDMLIHWVFNLDIKQDYTDEQKQTVQNAIWKLKELGWIELSTEMIFRGREKLTPKRYDTVKAWVKDNRIYNVKTNQFTDFKNIFNSKITI